MKSMKKRETSFLGKEQRTYMIDPLCKNGITVQTSLLRTILVRFLYNTTFHPFLLMLKQKTEVYGN